MTAGLVRHWLDIGRLEIALPGSGATARRWQRFAELAQVDIAAARVAEAHCDAVAILDELAGKPPVHGELWAVWAAESPDAVLTARASGDGAVLDGTKAWCSGAGFCSHALVTARWDDGPDAGNRGLFAIATNSPGLRPLPSTWWNTGMAGSDTRSVQFGGVQAVPVGGAGEYLSRPGFWHGGIGVAACWLGGARAVAAPLYARAIGDEHALAHLGAVDAAIAAADAMLQVAATQIDADPYDRSGAAELLARRTRAIVETAVDETLTRTGRALGPGPLSQDAKHAQRVADLSVYVRQSHAERDLAALGRLTGTPA